MKALNPRRLITDKISMSMPLLSNNLFEYVWLCFDKCDDLAITRLTRRDVRSEIISGNRWKNR